MRLGTKILNLVVLALLVMCLAVPAQAKLKPVPKIDNFILFQDYSGSMAMRYTAGQYLQKNEPLKRKIVLSKDLLFALNDHLPELGYNGSLHTFAPFSELQAMGPYSTSSMESAIAKIDTDYEIFQRRTPMGYGIADLRPVLDGLSGKTAIVLLSDGRHNEGIDPVEQAQNIYASYPNVCFHVVSFADEDYGKSVLEQIAALNACSCELVNGYDLLMDQAALEAWAQCVFYDLVNVCDGEVIVFRSIQFDFDRSYIRNDMKPILDEAIAIINENDCSYELEGHTCSIGSEAYNQGLSERRANSVKDYLAENGVDVSRLTAVGYGELQPKYDNSTREGRRMNRRVDIKVIE